MKSWIFFLVFLSGFTLLFPSELKFENGDVFLVEVVEETPGHLKVKFKEKIYLIPRTQIKEYKTENSGKDISYRISEFILKDASRIQGIVLKEDTEAYTVKTELGFLSISKDKIKSGPNPKPSEPEIPSQYLSSMTSKFQSKIGISMYGFTGKEIPLPGYGIGIYYEPEGMVIPWNMKLGYRADYSYSPSGVSFFQNSLYYKFHGNFFGLKSFLHLGPGVSFTSYKTEYETNTGVSPSLYLEAGVNIKEWESGFVRFSGRSVTIFESRGMVWTPGLEVSVGTFL